ncbi:MAG: hypothetical protein M3R30_05240 [Candidatus Eremiobacteraeota bacterium]|nr:hypothetical protein [Candidatus Eremiobacteraeota bacterium]
MKRWFSFALAVALIGATPAVNPALFSDLHWRMVGPFRGGRALAVSGVPGEPNHFYFGSVNGGVWESTNAGRTWNPIFDGQPIGSIGALAVAPSDPRVIYVGSGEADMRSDVATGIGMFVSRDGGHTWKRSGLTDTEAIGKIVVDPRNADVAYVAALGHQYGPNAERGVFKTTDGGASWSKVLFKDLDTGAIDLAMDPSDPKTVFASLWQTRRPPWNVYPPSNGPGSGIYVTHDAGASWSHLTSGLPANVGHVGLTISAANPKRIYAMVDTGADENAGGMYRSDDGGASWQFQDGKHAQVRIWKRGWYFGGITADPNDANVVYAMNTSTYRSTDAGKTFVPIKGSPGGDDYHTLWIDPTDSHRMVLGGDQGVTVSIDNAKTWSSWLNQPTAQFYHIALDDHFPYRLYGAQQDSGAIEIPSRSKHTGIGQFDWQPVDVGGESGSIAPDPAVEGRAFGSNGLDETLDDGAERTVDPTLGYPETIWRSTWTLPIVWSPADPHTLYESHQQIFRSRDRGRSWQTISPDLTRTNAGVPPNLDASTAADNLGLVRRGVVYAIAPSPRDARLIWAGTDDGLIWKTRDGGANWSNVTPVGLTAWSKVGIIEASHADANVAYAAVDRHRLDDFTPYIYRTRDGGAHWTHITDGIPAGLAVNVVREDPKNASLLYAGTERGVFVSFDAGDRWQSLQLDLPVTSVRDIAIKNGDVAIATHGRGFYILDEGATLLRQARATSGAMQLFVPAPAYRVRQGSDQGTPIQPDEPVATNPRNGVYVDYYLHEATRTPVVLTILDASGAVVRMWSSADQVKTPNYERLDIPARWVSAPPLPSASPGAHRWIWSFDSAGGPMVPPGRYRVSLRADGVTQTAPVTIVRDPRLNASDADLRAQYALANAILAKEQIVDAALKRAQAGHADAIVGAGAPDNPDDSEGKPLQNLQGLTYLAGAYANLEGAVASSDAAPTRDMRLGFAKLNATLTATLARLR